MSKTYDITVGQERDGTPMNTGKLSVRQFETYCEEIRTQPAWRKVADKCADYYDGNQTDEETLSTIRGNKTSPYSANMIKPTINAVLGMEAKTRLDWRVAADSDDAQEVAEALSAKLHEAERETRADRANSDAYASVIKTGVGWVEVSDQSDPFKYPIRVASIHRREMFWDWHSREPDLSDCRYQLRQRWFDIEQACSYMPKQAHLIRASMSNWDGYYTRLMHDSQLLQIGWENEQRTSMHQYEWLDQGRSRVCFTEAWYRQHVRGYILRLPQGVVELDLKNPVHAAAVGNGIVKPEPALYSKIFGSLWMGPHNLQDGVRAKKYPYIQFIGYREDLTGVPYGLIRDQISPQDDVNARARKLLWLLSARRLRVDNDALDKTVNSIEDVIRELNRPDAVVVTNPKRLNQNGFEVDNNIGLANQQFEVLQERKQAIQEVAGVFNAMMGRDADVKSGVAIDSLVEQGSVTLAEINDNYRYARMQVGEAILDKIKDQLSGHPVEVIVGEAGKRKTIFLNQPVVDPETGLQALANDIARTKTKVALEDVPSTPSYRAQQLRQLSEVISSMPPQVQAVLAPFYMEATDLPKRREVATLLRKVLGVPDGEDIDPEKAEMAAKIEELMQQLQAMQASTETAIANAKIDESKAKAAKTRAEALEVANRVEAQEALEPINRPEAEVEQIVFAA